MSTISILIIAGSVIVSALLLRLGYLVYLIYRKKEILESTVTGDCGDTMAVKFEVRNGKIMKIARWTDGCYWSAMALDTACAMVEEAPQEAIFDLSESAILNAIEENPELPTVPEDHYHCARLAAKTLRVAAGIQDTWSATKE